MGPEDTHVFANVDTAKMNIHVWRYKLAQVNVGATMLSGLLRSKGDKRTQPGMRDVRKWQIPQCRPGRDDMLGMSTRAILGAGGNVL